MDEEKEWWVCSICGPATHSRANWCDGGCGRDYQKMTKLVPETLLSTLREQIAREIEASNVNVFMTTPETIRAHYAAIARGE